MPATIDDEVRPLQDTRHEQCFVCGAENPRSLGLRFRPDSDGSVYAEFRSDPAFQGYCGILHGGVIATLLDAAMTHCLFHHGIAGLTGDLHVRYRSSVACGESCLIRARLEKAKQPVYRMSAEIRCGGCLKADAVASFMSMKETT